MRLAGKDVGGSISVPELRVDWQGLAIKPKASSASGKGRASLLEYS